MIRLWTPTRRSSSHAARCKQDRTGRGRTDGGAGGRFGDDCQIGDVCTIVEVLGPHGSQVAVRPGSDVRPHGLIGLLRMAETMALSGVRGEPAEGE